MTALAVWRMCYLCTWTKALLDHQANFHLENGHVKVEIERVERFLDTAHLTGSDRASDCSVNHILKSLLFLKKAKIPHKIRTFCFIFFLGSCSKTLLSSWSTLLLNFYPKLTVFYYFICSFLAISFNFHDQVGATSCLKPCLALCLRKASIFTCSIIILVVILEGASLTKQGWCCSVTETGRGMIVLVGSFSSSWRMLWGN